MATIQTDIPYRLDRLPWSRFHVLIVAALGITWILDGLEVTIVGSIGPSLQNRQSLGLTAQDIGTVASCYLVGAVVGALGFGWLTDRYGRRLVFYLTLGLYLVGVLCSAFSWNFASFALFRAITGAGIGGEYAAINSAIDELIPARLRGRVDLMVNGSFWLGAVLGAGGSLLLLDPVLFPIDLGWRLGFGIGGVLGFVILLLRRFVPESPRWLVTHGRVAEAEATVAAVEKRVDAVLPPYRGRTVTVHPRATNPLAEVFGAMLGAYRSRSVLALILMVAQAFLFNAVFFTYALVLQRFDGVNAARVGLYVLPLAVSNFAGPLALGRLFDTVGRRRMIAITFGAAGAMQAATALLFGFGLLTAVTQTLCWMAIFFVASAAASSAYLTASEIFPLESRAMAIAVFYALGTLVGGVGAPALFGALIATGHRAPLAAGYALAAVLMAVAAVTALRLGVDAEGKSLEDIAAPL